MQKQIYDYDAVVTRVIDGDTVETEVDVGFNLWLKRIRFRLVGVDTPELHDSDPVKREKANEAKQYTLEKLLGKSVYIVSEKDNEHDSFGRWLATIFLEDGTNFNATLLSEHLAEIWKNKDYTEYWESIKRLAEEKLKLLEG